MKLEGAIHKEMVSGDNNLESIVSDYLLSFSPSLKGTVEEIETKNWDEKDRRKIIGNILSLGKYKPGPRLIKLLYETVKILPKNINPDQASMLKTLTTKISRFEELKREYYIGVNWAYDIFLRWQDELAIAYSKYNITYFGGDIIESQEGVLKAVTAPREVREVLSEINELSQRYPFIPRHYQFGQIAAEITAFYRTVVIEKGNKQVFSAGKIFRKKALLGSYPEIISGLSNLPQSPPQKLVRIICDAVNAIDKEGREIIDDSLTESISKLIKTVNRSYKQTSEDEMNLFMENFEIDKSRQIKDTIKALNKQLLIYNSKGRRKIIEEIERTSESLDRLETKSVLYFMDKYQTIETILGENKAEEFRETVNLFRNIGMGRKIEFMELYYKLLCGEISREEERHLGPILANLSDYAHRKSENESALQEILMKGPTKCRANIRRELKKATGIEIEQYWDLRPLQRNLYSAYQAFLSYQELVDDRFEEDPYLELCNYLSNSDLLEEKILIVGGGCGIAKKETLLVKELREKGYEVELILIDKNKQVTDMALVNCAKEHIYIPPKLPPVRNWDLEKLNYSQFSEFPELLDRQIIFTLFGGTPFNIPNIWGLYSGIREVIHQNQQSNSHNLMRNQGEGTLMKAMEKVKGVFRAGIEKGREEEGRERKGKGVRKQDMLITEGDSEKDLAYYYRPASVEFLNKGIAEEYHISSEDLEREGPVFIMDEKEEKMKSFFLINEGHRFNSDGSTPAILVIDSGALNKDNFNRWMLGVGFKSEFLHYNNSTIAISTIQNPVKPYDQRVRYFIKSFERI